MKRTLYIFSILVFASLAFGQGDAGKIVVIGHSDAVGGVLGTIARGTAGYVLTAHSGDTTPTWQVNPGLTALNTSWKITGNAGTNSGTNYLGTSDTASLRFGVGGYGQALLDQYANLSVGSITGNYRNRFNVGSRCFAYGDENIFDTNSSTSFAFGSHNKIYAPWSMAVGQGNEIHLDNSFAVGASCKANSISAIATGFYTQAGIASFSCGEGIRVGNYSFGFFGGTGGTGTYHINNAADYSGQVDLTPLSHVFYIGSASLILDAIGGGGDLRFYATGHGFHDFATAKYTSFIAPNSLSANVIYVLPSTQGAAGTVLSNNGSGTLSWSVSNVYSYLWSNNADAPNHNVDAPNPAGLHDYILLTGSTQKILGTDLYAALIPFTRNIQLGVVHAVDSLALGDVVEVYGKNTLNAVIHETIILAYATNDTLDGLYAFKRIDSIILPARTNADSDYISIGYGDALGLDKKLSRDTQLHGYADNAKESSDCIVHFDATEVALNTVRFPTRSNNTSRRFDFYLTQ